MTIEVPKNALRLLTDLTGEPRFEVALWMALRDTVEHRLEKIAAERKAFEDKYQMDFTAFKQRWDTGQVPHQDTYEVEKDYLEWEGLITRQAKLEETAQWLPQTQ
ncbi:MAG: hypothetical protein M1482_16265 [Chloroflexi bacterium]|nr:hypothetical protein [Chloroflexota bacterium]